MVVWYRVEIELDKITFTFRDQYCTISLSDGRIRNKTVMCFFVTEYEYEYSLLTSTTHSKRTNEQRTTNNRTSHDIKNQNCE